MVPVYNENEFLIMSLVETILLETQCIPLQHFELYLKYSQETPLNINLTHIENDLQWHHQSLRVYASNCNW